MNEVMPCAGRGEISVFSYAPCAWHLMQICKLNVQKTFFTLAKELAKETILPLSVSYNTIYRSVILFALIQQGLVDI